MTSELALVFLAAGATISAIYAAPQAVLPTIAIIALVASVAWLATYQKNPLVALTQQAAATTCDATEATCPVNRCAIQSMDNPFGNPSMLDFGESTLYADRCSLDRGKALLKAREHAGGVQFAEDLRFHKVPTFDAADYRQWLFDIPENCKHNQRACNPRPTIIDAVRRSELTGSFSDYI